MAAFTDAAVALLANEYPFVRACDFGHWGDGGTHLNLVWKEEEAPRPTGEIVEELQAKIYELAVRGFAGSFSAEHGVGPHNQRFYDAYTSEPVKGVNHALKLRLDPKALLGTTHLD
jgi:FAD/FMN-containing dehydrogenase